MKEQSTTFGSIANNTAQQWFRDPGLRVNVLHCYGVCLVIFYLGYDAGLINGLQGVSEWQDFLSHPTGTRLGLYAASLYLPSILTAYVGDVMSQRFGRRPALACGSFVVLFGSFINAFAINAAMWVAGRAIIGMGGGIAKVAAPALIQEIAHPRLRPVLAACYFSFYYFGALLSALLCFAALYIPGYWSWRVPSVFQVVGPIVVLLTLFSCPESPRWLISKNRSAEASHILSRYHANGATDDPLVAWELREIENVLANEYHNNQSSYREFLATSGNRRRLIVLLSLCVGLNWVGNGIIAYYLIPVLQSVGITSSTQIMFLTCGLAIWNLLFAFSASFSVERIGRRPLFITSLTGMLVAYSLLMGFAAAFANTGNHRYGTLVVVVIFIYYAFYAIAWTPLPVPYTTEILPFKLRTKGLALFTSVGTMANAFNQFVNPVALDALAWKYYAVYITILLFYLVFAYFMYPETRHRTIEEVSVLFDRVHVAAGPEVVAEVSGVKGGAMQIASKRVDEEAIEAKRGSCSHREHL